MVQSSSTQEPQRFQLQGTTYCIREMNEADLDAVLDIERNVQTHPWKLSHFQNCLQIGNVALVVTEITAEKKAETVKQKNGEASASVTAFAIVSCGGGEAELLNIAVAPRYQQRGIARQLLQTAMDGVSAQAENMFLEVRRSNRVAICLYEDMGFNQVGERRNYYPSSDPSLNGREDAYIFARTLAVEP